MDYVLLTTLRKYENEGRMDEIMWAVARNCENKWISKYIIFFQNFESSYFVKYPILQHEKIRIELIQNRMSYNNIFAYCNQNFHNIRCMVSNADIYFDNNIEYLYCLNYNNLFISLTRYDRWPGEQNYTIKNTQGSYDTYVFMPQLKIPETEILFGINGCDSWLVRKMYELGYYILNPCLNIPSYHHHGNGVGGTSFDDGTSYWHAPGYNPYYAPFTKV